MTASTACRSAIRSTPRSRRKRRASTSPRPASTAAPRSTPATASSIDPLPRRLFRLSPFRDRGDGAIATTFDSRAMRGGRIPSNRRGTAGAAASARNISTATSASGRGEVPARQAHEPARPVRAADARSRRRSRPKPAALRAYAPRADADPILGNPDLRRTFDAISGSLGAAYDFAPGSQIGLNGSRAQRAPSAEELFANGPHAGTQLSRSAIPISASSAAGASRRRCAATGDGFSLGASVFHSWFDGYIYEPPTGAIATIFRSSSIFRPMRAISASNWKARLDSPDRRLH